MPESQKRRLWPLRRVLGLAFVALALLAVLPVAAFNGFETGGIVRTLTATQLRQYAAATAASFDEHVRGLEDWGRTLAASPEARALLAEPDPPPEAAREAWEQGTPRQVIDAEDLNGIFLARADGALLAATGTMHLPSDLHGWRPFAAAVESRDVVIAPYDVGRGDAQFLVLFPFVGPHGRIAVIGLGDDLAMLQRRVNADTRALGSGGFGLLTDEYGVRLADGRDPLLEGVPIGALPPNVSTALQAQHRLRPSEDPSRFVGEDGVEGARVALTSAPWVYALDLPAHAFEAPARRQLVRVAVSTLIAVGLAILYSQILSSWLSQPFQDLETAFDAWREGQRGVRARAGGTLEAARIREAFNQMAVEIESYERSLQDRVAERTAQLEAANRDLELFTYSASHDLRAPLRVLDGLATAVLEDEGDALSDDGRDLLRRLTGTVDRMARLVDKLLAFGRVTRQDLVRERVDLSAMSRDAAADLQREEPDRRVTFHVADGLFAVADPALLRTVLDNLLGNAWKFTRQRDDARIEVGVTAEDPPAFFVRDNGAGFDMAHAGRLFTPFARLHAASDFPGTGIGLATVQRIVERHGGRVWARGEVGEGATFYFTFPGRDVTLLE